MTNVRTSAAIMPILLGSVPASSEHVGAVEVTGAWATSAEQCSKVFVRGGRANEITFTATSDRYGGGFIIEANRVRGKSTTCMIKSRKDGTARLSI
jgi:hypothetical protein